MKKITFLLVEDNPADVHLTRLGLEQSKISSRLLVAEDAETALDILHKRNGHEKSHNPDVILLDLNLPGIDGHEFLEIVKKDTNFLQIPIVVLSTSNSEIDMLKSYMLHANFFVVKPMDAKTFLNIVQEVEKFFSSIVSLP